MNKNPDESLLDEIKSCTEANHHLHANYLVAKWCEENCVEDESSSWSTDVRQERFRYFKDYFSQLEDHVRKVTIAPFWEISCEMGRELDKEIVRQFGENILSIFNSVR